MTPSHHRTAIAFMCKDRVELSEQSIRPLLHLPIDLFIVDGSTTEEGKTFPSKIAMEGGHEARIMIHGAVRGGPDAAFVYAITTMLKGGDYEYFGVVENDVKLHKDWYGPTAALFKRGAADGLEVGAVSARAYEDRILFQRDGYAVMHGLGWGMLLLTRRAASLTLDNMRTSMTIENRKTFCQLTGKDLATYWAFKAFDHQLCSDWGNDRMLASHGLASLALVPSPVEMIGQVPSLAEQGLKIASEPVEWLRDDGRFNMYVDSLQQIIRGTMGLPRNDWLLHDQGGYTIFPHHVPKVGGVYEGDWRLKWVMGFGPFVWKAGQQELFDRSPQGDGSRPTGGRLPSLTVPLYGSVSFLVSGGETGGKVNLVDTHSGYEITPELPPEGQEGKILNLTVPGSVTYRTLKLTMLTPGTCLYAIRATEQQPWLPGVKFDWHTLPRV